MLIAITEFNAWENERWTYVLDMDKQDGAVLNDLMIFIRLANIEFEKIKESAEYRLFAASKYTFRFYKQLDMTRRCPRLVNKNNSLIIASDPGYHSNSFDLTNIISSKRMRSAMLAIRDKKDNILYKDFDSLFLKSKVKKED